MVSGRFSAQQFEDGAQGFAQRWAACSSAEQLWTWVASGNKLDAGYLQLEGVSRPQGSRSEEHPHPAPPPCSPDNPDEAVAWQPPAMHLYSFSIAYQPSYCVPVLLFQGRGPDGAPLAWEETLSDLPEAPQATARHGDARWSFITPQEHPVTRMPMHGIHPCETATLMSLLLAQDSDDASGGSQELGEQHSRHTHQSTEPNQTVNRRELSTGESAATGGTEDGRRQQWLPPTTGELRYMCGWYSIVAPVVGLPLPLGMCGSGA